MNDMNPYAELKPERTLFGKYWIALLVIALILLLAGSLVGFIMTFADDVAKVAVATAEQNPVMAAQVGLPLKQRWLVTGQTKESPTSGTARIAVPVSGPKGSGTLYVEAHKQAGLWQLDQLQFAPRGSEERIDLLPPPEHPE